VVASKRNKRLHWLSEGGRLFHFHVLRQRLANFRFLRRTIKSTRVDYESPLKLEAEQGVTTDVMYEGEVPV